MRVKVSEKKGKDKPGDRMALLGITSAVISTAVVVNLCGALLKGKELQYQMKEETLQRHLEQEGQRAEWLERQRIYVQIKQYIEEVAKEKLGLMNPDEILLRPAE